MSALNFYNIFIFPNFIKSLSYMFLATRQIVHSFSGENNYTYVSLVVKGNYVKRSKSVKIYFVTDCSFKLFWRLNQFSGLALTNWNLLFFYFTLSWRSSLSYWNSPLICSATVLYMIGTSVMKELKLDFWFIIFIFAFYWWCFCYWFDHILLKCTGLD